MHHTAEFVKLKKKILQLVKNNEVQNAYELLLTYTECNIFKKYCMSKLMVNEYLKENHDMFSEDMILNIIFKLTLSVQPFLKTVRFSNDNIMRILKEIKINFHVTWDMDCVYAIKLLCRYQKLNNVNMMYASTICNIAINTILRVQQFPIEYLTWLEDHGYDQFKNALNNKKLNYGAMKYVVNKYPHFNSFGSTWVKLTNNGLNFNISKIIALYL